MRPFLIALTLAAAFPAGGRLWAASADAVIPVPTAEQHGMARPWCTQVQLNHGRGRVCDLVLHEGVLYVQTDRATITALDAETGHQLWSKMIGRPEHPSMTPDVSSDLLATVNGSRLFVCNRYTGEVLFETQVDGAPGAGPGLSQKFAYVPMVGGMIVAYRLEPLVDPLKELGKLKKDMTPEEKAAEEEDRRQNLRLRQEYIPPVFCQSAGRALVQPLVTLQNREEEFVVWPTDRGVVSFGRVDRRDPTALVVKHELRTDAAIVSRPAYLPPDPHVHGDMAVIYATSRDGRVYAMLERSGEMLWKFPAAEPVLESPAVIDNRVYVCTQLGGMFCLDAKSGKQYWAPEIMHFVAAGRQRVYASDQAGRTQVLAAKTGARLDVLPTEMLPIKLMNTQTDRLYLATDTGLVQCLHEIDLGKPILHGEDRKPKLEEEPEKPKPGVKKPKTDEGDQEKPKPKPRPKPSGEKPPKKQPKDKTPKDKVKKAIKDKVDKSKDKNTPPDQGGAATNPFGGN